jgi:predicted transcriptional regulator
VLEFIKTGELVSRERIVGRFQLDGELEVSAVLHDLTESGLVFCSGSGRSAVYRRATDEELGQLAQLNGDVGFEELCWVLVYRNGPIGVSALSQLLRRSEADTAQLVERLCAAGRVQKGANDTLSARDFVVPLGASIGWEASVFDHVQAVVQTICQRLRQNTLAAGDQDPVGGSTYSYDVWPNHPLEAEVKDQLSRFRQRAGELRRRVEAYNQQHGLRREYQQVVHYAGQCVLERELDATEGDNHE